MFTAMIKKLFNQNKPENEKLIGAGELAKAMNVPTGKLNKALISLGWAEQNQKWWIATDEGKAKGAEQRYNAKTKSKYILWPESIKENEELITELQNIPKTRTSAEEKIKKGKEYEKYIADLYREQGYTIAEHGIDNGVKDHGIDIIAKKGKEILFIQCKNWSAKNSYRIRDKEIKVTRQDAKDYLMKNPLYTSAGYQMKIVYITSENVMHGSAYHYIKEHSDIIEHKIIPMPKNRE